jgi:hypothetical protein
MNFPLIIKTVMAWVIYSLLFTIAFTINDLIVPFLNSGIPIEWFYLAKNFGLFFAQALLLLFTGFLVYGFLLLGLDVFSQAGKQANRKIMKAITLYLLTTASLLITYFISYKSLPVTFMVDAPLMNTVTLIVFILIPGLNRGLLDE